MRDAPIRIRPRTIGPYSAQDRTVKTYRGEVLAACASDADAAFVAHAASHYTMLIAMLQDLILDPDTNAYTATLARGHTMLKSLNELKVY